MCYVRHMRDMEGEHRVPQAQVFLRKGLPCITDGIFLQLACLPSFAVLHGHKEADNGNTKSNNIKQLDSSKELCRKCNAWFLPSFVDFSLIFIRLKAASGKKWR